MNSLREIRRIVVHFQISNENKIDSSSESRTEATTSQLFPSASEDIVSTEEAAIMPNEITQVAQELTTNIGNQNPETQSNQSLISLLNAEEPHEEQSICNVVSDSTQTELLPTGSQTLDHDSTSTSITTEDQVVKV